ncbi:MAG TPA: D-alanyl-D-alanine carboxypeptidase family protein [Dehalococcoidia bacterium]|nr:D-alanyl-D-alanine carboxypeptidase family protein [Dehalococcoidia bacterium]
MQQPSRPLRTTSTPLRRQRRPAPRFPALAVFFLLGAISLGAWIGLGRSAGEDVQESAGTLCPDAACAGAQVEARPVAVVSGPTPCAYCGQDPNRWRSVAVGNTPPPEIGGKSAAIIEASCGALLYGFNENERRPPASLTKMAAAMATLKHARLNDMVEVKINGWDLASDDNSTIMGLEAGMRLSVQDLLYGMMLVSGNDAALALADHLGRDRFVGWMNDEVRRLGLVNTRFVTADGRDAPGHYSTALDMALLGRALLQEPFLKQVVNTKNYTPRWSGPTLWNNNEMIYAYSDAVGVKTGYTETADFTIVTGVQRNGRLLIASVFGSWNLYWDPVRLLNWAFENTRSACPS